MSDSYEEAERVFRQNFKGKIYKKGEEGYEEARKPKWNLVVTARPSFFLLPEDVADIQAALSFARRIGEKVTVSSSGGHSFFSQREGAICLSLSLLNSVSLSPEKRQVTVGGGCLLQDIDLATAKFGYHVPLGVVSHTGVGLILGGGVGWLSRLHGASCDSLLSAKVVTGDGEYLEANEKENASLFFSLKGGAGVTGIVTEMTLQGYDYPGKTFSLVLSFSLSSCGKEVLDHFANFISDPKNEANRRAGAALVCTYSPEGEKRIQGIFILHPKEREDKLERETRDLEEGERETRDKGGRNEDKEVEEERERELQREGEELFSSFLSLPHQEVMRGLAPFTAIQQMFDKEFDRAFYYFSGFDVVQKPSFSLQEKVLQLLQEQNKPHRGGIIMEWRSGRYREKHGARDTLIRKRDGLLELFVFVGWEKEEENGERFEYIREWKRELEKAVREEGGRPIQGMNFNAMDGVDAEKIGILSLLQELKGKYDSENLILSGFRNLSASSLSPTSPLAEHPSP